MKHLLKVRWVVDNSSIVTEKYYPIKIGPFGTAVQHRRSIAFNVGDLAYHIVKIHNNQLENIHETT